jgi:hypothetical protein
MSWLRARILGAIGVAVAHGGAGCAPSAVEPRQGPMPTGSAAGSSAPPEAAPLAMRGDASAGNPAASATPLSPFGPSLGEAGEASDAASSAAPPRPTAPVAPLRCGRDEVRELECVGGQVCPAEFAAGAEFSPDLSAGDFHSERPARRVFDPDFARRPRFSGVFSIERPCCYAVCDPISPTAATRAPNANNTICVGAPEGGTSQPAPPPHQRCPRGLKMTLRGATPAAFDAEASEKQSDELSEAICCYSYYRPRPNLLRGRPFDVGAVARVSPLLRGQDGWGGTHAAPQERTTGTHPA